MATAVFTIADDEQFLARWCQYHAKAFDVGYVLWHVPQPREAGTLPAVGGTGFEIIPVQHRHVFDTEWLVQTVQRFQAFLLQSFSLVAFVSVDSFLVTRTGTLRQYVQALVASRVWAVRATGYEICHYQGREPAIDWQAPKLLSQRQYWIPAAGQSRPVMAKNPLYWTAGFADAVNMPASTDPNLLLLHVHRIDFEACLRRHRCLCACEWPADPMSSAPYGANRITDQEQLWRWLLSNPNNVAEYASLQYIPAEVQVF
jgi:hypothetical protein